MKKKKKDPDILVCDDCGTKENNVSINLCPYAQEINNKDIEVCLCDKCYQERVWDIRNN